MKLERSFLVNELRTLQGDEFSFKDIAGLPKNELILMLIECAYYYRNEWFEEMLNH
jgi:hypothetical protein